MEPEVNIMLHTYLPNNSWSKKKFRNLKLKIENDMKKGVKCLVIGKNAQKVKLQVTANILEIFQHSLDSLGKVTFRFKTPPVNCFIQVTTVTGRNKALLRNIVQQIKSLAKGKDYRPPSKIIPYSPETSTVQEEGKWATVGQKLQLAESKLFLTILDLSGRGLTSLPKEIGDLNLVQLILTKNELGRTAQPWSWLYGHISRTLNILALNENQLIKLPSIVAGCTSLTTLCLEDNDLEWLPPLLLSPLLGSLKELRLSNNARLRALPYPCRFLEKLDIVGCSGLSEMRSLFITHLGSWPGIQLKEIAGQAVLQQRVQFDVQNLPRELIDFLYSSCHCDHCSRLVPSSKLYTFRGDVCKARQTVASGRHSVVYYQHFLCVGCCKLFKWRGIRL